MRTAFKLSILILLSSLFFGCSIQKRRYNKGFHVEWNVLKFKSKKIKSDDLEEVQPLEFASEEDTQSEENESTNFNYDKAESMGDHDHMIVRDSERESTQDDSEKNEVARQEEEYNRSAEIKTDQNINSSNSSTGYVLLLIFLILLVIAIAVSAYFFTHWSLINILAGTQELYHWIILLSCSGLFAIFSIIMVGWKQGLLICAGMLLIFVGFVLLEFFVLPTLPWLVRIISLLCAYAWLVFTPSIG